MVYSASESAIRATSPAFERKHSTEHVHVLTTRTCGTKGMLNVNTATSEMTRIELISGAVVTVETARKTKPSLTDSRHWVEKGKVAQRECVV